MDGAGPAAPSIGGDDGAETPEYHSLPDSLPVRLRGVRETGTRYRQMRVTQFVHHMMAVTASEVKYTKTFFAPGFPFDIAKKLEMYGDMFYTQDSFKAAYIGEWALGWLEEKLAKDGSKTLVFNVVRSKCRASTDGYINLVDRLRCGTKSGNSEDPGCYLISNTLKTFEFAGVLVNPWHRRGMLVMCRSRELRVSDENVILRDGFAGLTQWAARADAGVFRCIVAFL